MKVGIAMVPSTEAIEALVDLQKKVLSICPLRPVLGTECNLPHITLLQGRFRNSMNWVSLISELRDCCRNQNYSLEFKVTGLEYKPPGWYFLTLNPNVIFAEAQKFIFERLKDSMFLTEEDLQKNTSDYTDLEKQNYFRYGYRYIDDAFQPHITLGRTTQNCRILYEVSVIDLVERLISTIAGVIQKITVYEIGENGSHASTLYELEI